ncbi:hypothetical protein H6798_02645 [Candidatus Nomurabacteria bacterium]|nr:hypothetical protein [Candidatus Nomurabacteria bacterium]
MRFSRHQQPEIGIEPLSQSDRESFPAVIYEQQATSINDATLLIEAVGVARALNLPFAIDVDTSDEGLIQAVVRSSAKDRFEARIHSALFHGTSAMICEHMPDPQTRDEIGATLVRSIAQSAIEQIVRDEDLEKGFGIFYSGLRWHTDQEKFVSTLFKSAAELDFERLDQMVTTGEHILAISYGIEHGVSWDTTREWRKMTAEQVLEAHPEFDYRKLQDPEFRATDEGKALEKAYNDHVGEELVRRYRTTRANIDSEGKVIPKPILPLARFPLIESLIVDEIRMISPKTKYNFGPSDVSGLILDSDSLKAQQALVAAVTTRIAPEQRHVIDGPDELQQKRGIIIDILRTYQDETDPKRKAQFKDQIIKVIEAYTRDGRVAADVRAEYYTSSTDRYVYGQDVRAVRNILGDILKAGLASPHAQEIVGRLMQVTTGELTKEVDPISLGYEEFEEAILESVWLVDEQSDPDFIESIAARMFGRDLAAKIRYVICMRAEAKMKSSQPEVVLAHKKWANNFAPFDSQEAKDLKQAYLSADSEGQALRDKADAAMNEVLLTLIERLAFDPDSINAENRIRSLIQKLRLGNSSDMEQLPDTYYMLMEFARDPRVTSSTRASILWRFAEHYKYAADGLAARQVTKIIIDGYHLMLGDPNLPLSVPDHGVSDGLYAINQLASHNVFKQADETQLLELSRYRFALLDLIQRFTGRQLTSGRLEDIDLSAEKAAEAEDNRTTYHIESVVRSFQKLEKQYEEFLYLEEVRRVPHVYYPWVLRQLVPFWQKMQWEVSPGNRPSYDITRLHKTIEDLISSRLVVEPGHEFDTSFDPMDDGHIDELLVACYEQMVVPHDIKNKQTVWTEGMSFMNLATTLMPVKLLERLKAKYGENHGLVKLVINEQKRFSQDEE